MNSTTHKISKAYNAYASHGGGSDGIMVAMALPLGHQWGQGPQSHKEHKLKTKLYNLYKHFIW